METGLDSPEWVVHFPRRVEGPTTHTTAGVKVHWALHVVLDSHSLPLMNLISFG